MKVGIISIILLGSFAISFTNIQVPILAYSEMSSTLYAKVINTNSMVPVGFNNQQPSQDLSSSFQTYNDATYGITIDYPANWRANGYFC